MLVFHTTSLGRFSFLSFWKTPSTHGIWRDLWSIRINPLFYRFTIMKKSPLFKYISGSYLELVRKRVTVVSKFLQNSWRQMGQLGYNVSGKYLVVRGLSANWHARCGLTDLICERSGSPGVTCVEFLQRLACEADRGFVDGNTIVREDQSWRLQH